MRGYRYRRGRHAERAGFRFAERAFLRNDEEVDGGIRLIGNIYGVIAALGIPRFFSHRAHRKGRFIFVFAVLIQFERQREFYGRSGHGKRYFHRARHIDGLIRPAEFLHNEFLFARFQIEFRGNGVFRRSRNRTENVPLRVGKRFYTAFIGYRTVRARKITGFESFQKIMEDIPF